MKMKYINYVFAFIIFAFLGFFLEYFASFIFHYPTHQFGQALFLIFGIKVPFLLIYGFGGVIIWIITKYLIDKKTNILLIGFIDGVILTLVELIGGFICIGLFGHNLWSYSKDFLNFYGIISLESFMLWIALGYVFTLLFYLFYHNKK